MEHVYNMYKPCMDVMMKKPYTFMKLGEASLSHSVAHLYAADCTRVEVKPSPIAFALVLSTDKNTIRRGVVLITERQS